MKIFKNSIIKILGITLLIIGGIVSIMALPKFFSMILTKIVDAIPTDPTYDKDGKMMYRDGRHTIVSFGNKRFSIEKGVWDGETTKCLIDRKKSGPEATIDYIEKYKEILSCVYTIGEKGFTKLNYETSEVIQSKNIDDFSEEDKEIFKAFD